MTLHSFHSYRARVAIVPFALAVILLPGTAVAAVYPSGMVDALHTFGRTIGFAETDPGLIIAHLIKIGLQFVGIILVVMIIFSGIGFLFSGGKDENMKKARRSLAGTIIGLIIILSAYSIVSFIFTAFNSAASPAI